MDLQTLRRDHRRAILELTARHGASNVRVFGSVARGEADDKSDIDLLVDFEPNRSLLDLGGLLMDLQAYFSVDVDVLTPESLRTSVRTRVLQEAIPL